MKVETCGDSWKVVKSVLIFICTPAISICLASKLSTQNIPILLAIIIPPPIIAPFGAVFSLISFKLVGPSSSPRSPRRSA